MNRGIRLDEWFKWWQEKKDKGESRKGEIGLQQVGIGRKEMVEAIGRLKKEECLQYRGKTVVEEVS